MSVSENPRFWVADFATLSDERSRSKIVLLFIRIQEPCVRKSEGLTRSKILGILQTDVLKYLLNTELFAYVKYFVGIIFCG